MQLSYYQVDAFAFGPFSGNPAGVCVLDSWLEDSTLQGIAMENNLSETAFIVGDNGEYELRWFTPSCEVDLCGHATMASAHVVFDSLEPESDRVHFSTRSGDLKVTTVGGLLNMNFPVMEGTPCTIPDGLEKALGVEIIDAVSSRDLMVRVKDAEAVQNLAPDMDFISSDIDKAGLIVTAEGDDCDFVSRYFGPAVGIPEDPVTGSAHCLLAPYWSKKLVKRSFVARQLSKRGGVVYCDMLDDRVMISGAAIKYLDGTITL